MTTTCPRCGYDLSASPPTWVSQCPMQGTCSECAFEFSWGDLLRREFLLRTRFFEHAEIRRAAAFFFTLRKTFRPGTFWLWVKLESPTRLMRALLFAILSTGVTLVTGAVVYTGLSLANQRIRGWLPRIGEDPTRWLLNGARSLRASLLPLFYVSNYAHDGAIPAFGLWLTPHPMRVIAVCAAVSAPFAYVLLPLTRRTQALSVGQFARVMLYGLAPTALMLQIPPILRTAAAMTPAWRLVPSVTAWWAPPALMLLFQFIWWRAAARHYLELRRPNSFAAATVAITFLAALVVAVLIAGPVVHDDLPWNWQ